MNSIKTRSKVPDVVVFTTLCMAFFCDVKSINSFLVAGSGYAEDTEGPMAMLYFISVVGVFLFGLTNKGNSILKTPMHAWFIFIWVVFFYFITLFFIAPPYTKVPFFGVFTLASFLMPFVAKIDARIFLKAMMAMAAPAIFRINEVFAFKNEYFDIISMGKSYAFLTPVVAAIVYMFVFYSKETRMQKNFTILLFFVNMVFAYYLISFGSRGPVMAIILTVTFLIVCKTENKKNGIRMKKGRFVLAFASIIFALVFFVTVMSSLQSLLGGYGLSFNFIDKFLRMDESGDVSNGRQVIYMMAMNDILNNPLWGMGLDQFANRHGEIATYPHNFIIQIFYDGGILFFLVLAIPLWKGVKRLWKECSTGEYAVFVALLFSSVPRAMVSGDLWQNGPLWMLISAILSKSFVIGKKA